MSYRFWLGWQSKWKTIKQPVCNTRSFKCGRQDKRAECCTSGRGGQRRLCRVRNGCTWRWIQGAPEQCIHVRCVCSNSVLSQVTLDKLLNHSATSFYFVKYRGQSNPLNSGVVSHELQMSTTQDNGSHVLGWPVSWEFANLSTSFCCFICECQPRWNDNLRAHPFTLRTQFISDQCPLPITDTKKRIKVVMDFYIFTSNFPVFSVLCQLLLPQSCSFIKTGDSVHE